MKQWFQKIVSSIKEFAGRIRLRYLAWRNLRQAKKLQGQGTPPEGQQQFQAPPGDGQPMIPTQYQPPPDQQARQPVDAQHQAQPQGQEPAPVVQQAPPAQQAAGNPASNEPPPEPAPSPAGPPPSGQGSFLQALQAWKDKVVAYYRRLDPKQRSGLLASAGVLLVILLVIPMYAVTHWAADEVIQVFAPVVSEDKYFGTGGRFDISGVSGLSEEYLQENLILSPASEFTVTKISEDVARVVLSSHHDVTYTVTIRNPVTEDIVSLAVNNQAMTLQLVNSKPNSVEPDEAIVISLSDPVDESTFSRSITLTPSHDYTVRVTGNTAIITPMDGWEYGRRYTLGVNRWMTSITGRQLGVKTELEFKVVAKPVVTETKTPSVTFVSPDSEMWRDGDPFYMEFHGENLSNNVPVVMHTYRMDNIDKYKDQRHVVLNYSVNLSTMMEKVESNAYLIKKGTNVLTVPNPGPGAYVVEAVYTDPSSSKEVTRKAAYLVSDISVYMQTSGGETLVWINHHESGNSLEGYTATFYDDGKELVSVTTDNEGIGILNYQVEDYWNSANSLVVVTDGDGDTVYVDTTNILGSYDSPRDRYYSYFYIDRALYKPTDTINFWGFVRPYEYNTKEMPETVTVFFDEGGLDIEVEAEIESSGVFTGEIELDAVKSSQYYISAKLRFEKPPAEEDEEEGDELPDDEDELPEDDEELPEDDEDEEGEDEEEEEPEPEYSYFYLDSIYVDIKEYEKPTFTISSAVDRNYYTSEDEVTVTITPTFFDGTPLPNYELEFTAYNVYTYNWGSIQKVTTDDDGIATVTFPAVVAKGGLSSWMQTTGQYRVQIASDGENITHVGRYTYFPSDIVFTGDLTGDGRTATLDMEFYNFNAANLRAMYDTLPLYSERETMYNILRGTGADVDVRVEFEWTFYDLRGDRRTGSRKAVQSTSNGRVSLEQVIGENIRLDSERYYYLRAYVDFQDGVGNTFTQSYYYYNPAYSYDYDYYRDREEEKPTGYTLLAYDSNGEQVQSEYYYYMPYDSVTFPAAENMSFQLAYDGEPVANDGRIMYTLIQDNIIDRSITTADTIDLRQQVAYANTVNLVAAYFDGGEVHIVRSMVITLDKSSIAVDLDVTPNQDTYRPGENVQLSVSATDAQGNGVQGNLLISVVDESVFALRDQGVYVLSTLYGSMDFSHYYVKRYATVPGDYTTAGGGSEGKGGPDSMAFYDSFRSNFKDTAVFLPTRTDANGNAVVNFELPDNTTSWRITALTIGDNLYAGQSKSNIISTLPFFMNPVISSKYIEGDDVAMLVQGHGTLLNSESEMSYVVSITGDGVNETIEAQGIAYHGVQVNFGQLPMGEYTVTATARYSGYSDTVQLPLSVIKSNLELVIHKQVDLTQPLDISAVRYPVVMSFYDEQNDAFYRSISSLLGHYCMVANQRMSRFAAKRALAERMDPETIPYYIREGNDNASDMQNDDGGIGWYVGSPSELELTTKILLFARDQFDLNAMRRYYADQLAGTRDPLKQAYCYLGLAVIGDNVEKEVLAMLDKNPALDVRAYLVAALHFTSDEETAQQAYQNRLAKHLNTTGETKMIRGKDNYTAAIWIAASFLDQDDADAISLYFCQNPWRYSTLFECMIYVVNYSREVTPRTFNYTVNGATQSVDLGFSGQRSVTFNRSQFDSLRFSNVPEGIMAMAYYVGEPTEIDIEQSENMKVTKSITPIGSENYRISINIEFEDEAPTGQYDISEWVPSNMRLYKMNSNYRTSYTTEGQKIYFTHRRVASDSSADRNKVNIVYYARKTYDAEAVVDTTYVIHGDTGDNCNTERSTVGG